MNKLVNGKLVPLTQAEIDEVNAQQLIAEQEQAKQLIIDANNAIYQQLEDIDKQRVRPTAELLLDSTNKFARDKLTSLDAQAVALRVKLQ